MTTDDLLLVHVDAFTWASESTAQSKITSANVIVDFSPPSPGWVFDVEPSCNGTLTSSDANSTCGETQEADIDSVGPVTEVRAWWSGFLDSQTEVVSYDVCLGSSQVGIGLAGFSPIHRMRSDRIRFDLLQSYLIIFQPSQAHPTPLTRPDLSSSPPYPYPILSRPIRPFPPIHARKHTQVPLSPLHLILF